MSQAVQAALPWIVCAIAAAILIPGIIDFLRKKRTVPDEGEEIWDESAIDSFYRGEDAKTVRECMDRLNNDYRTVLYLVYFEEVDGDGAAKIMGKSKKQLANLLYRAKQALKTELEKEGFCYEDR